MSHYLPSKRPLFGWRGRDCDSHGPVYAGRPKYDRCYALPAGGHQGNPIGKSMGTCITRGKEIGNRKDSGAIGTAELYGAVDNRVPVSTGHRGNRHGKRRTCNCGRGSADDKICSGCSAAERH